MKLNNRLFVNVHVLQTLHSFVNCGITGCPDGGVLRAMISSESWKRPIRKMFMDIYPDNDLAQRTKQVEGMISDEIKKMGGVDNPGVAAQKILETAGLKNRSTKEGAGALFFISIAQVKALAKLAKEYPEIVADNPSEEVRLKTHNALKNIPGIDRALFGNSSVANTLSTHGFFSNYDIAENKEHLAPHTFYRYSAVCVHQLHLHAGADTAKAVCRFVKAFVLSIPGGKQNAFANHPSPNAVFVTLRPDMPFSLKGAFESPVQARENESNSYLLASAKALVEHAHKMYGNEFKKHGRSLVTSDLFSELGEVYPFEVLLDKLMQNVNDCLKNFNNAL